MRKKSRPVFDDPPFLTLHLGGVRVKKEKPRCAWAGCHRAASGRYGCLFCWVHCPGEPPCADPPRRFTKPATLESEIRRLADVLVRGVLRAIEKT